MAVYETGTGTFRPRVWGTWGRKGRDTGTSSMGHGDVWDGKGEVKYRDARDVGTLMFIAKIQVAVAKIYLEQEHSIPNK